MPRVLEHLEPKAVFHFFEDLTRIPHGSRNTKAISDYCAAFAALILFSSDFRVNYV